jgi:hypothetical protein
VAPPDPLYRAPELLDEALAQAERAKEELRELAHGILPVALTRGGLRGGVVSPVDTSTTPRAQTSIGLTQESSGWLLIRETCSRS